MSQRSSGKPGCPNTHRENLVAPTLIGKIWLSQHSLGKTWLPQHSSGKPGCPNTHRENVVVPTLIKKTWLSQHSSGKSGCPNTHQRHNLSWLSLHRTWSNAYTVFSEREIILECLLKYCFGDYFRMFAIVLLCQSESNTGAVTVSIRKD